jgi:AcrR family transcriptional regulator
MAVSRLSAGERKQAIVEAAIRLFSEKGFHGVTTRELAHAVGVSEPVLYQYYQNKHELYAAIVESKSREVACNLGTPQSLVADLDQDDRTILCGIANKITRWYEDDPALNRLLLYSALEGQEFSDLFFARHASLFFDALIGYFEHRTKQGIFRGLDASICAWAFLGMLSHQSMTRALYHFDPYPQPKERLVSQMVDLFLQGLQAQRNANATTH